MAKAATVEQMGQKTEQEVEHVKEKAAEATKPVEPAVSAMERLPSPLFMGLAGGSVLLSLILFFRKDKEDAIFVGHWAPTFLLTGMFLKLVGAKMRD